MDQKGLVFVPHVLAVEKGTTVTFLNSDSEQHNVYFLFDSTGETLDIGTWGPNVSVDHRFDEPDVVITLCKLHLEMAAYVVVLDNPWFAVVQVDNSASTARLVSISSTRCCGPFGTVIRSRSSASSSDSSFAVFTGSSVPASVRRATVAMSAMSPTPAVAVARSRSCSPMSAL